MAERVDKSNKLNNISPFQQPTNLSILVKNERPMSVNSKNSKNSAKSEGIYRDPLQDKP